MRRRPENQSQRRGAILPLTALLLFILFGCLAYAIDVAYMQLVKVELKTSVDAAARAGGEALTRTQSVEHARLAAHNLAGLNHVAGEPLLLQDADIIPGHATLSQQTGRWSFEANETPFNSIRVIGRRTRPAPSGSVPLFFGKIYGWHEFEVQRQATAVRLDRDIVLVVDRSSSMKLSVDHPTGNMPTNHPNFPTPPPLNSRWKALEAAVEEFISALDETPQIEWVSLVSYASNYNAHGVNNTEADIDQALTENHGLINAKMNIITNRKFNGLTHITAGLDKGVVALLDESTSRQYAMKTIVLMTDGIPNPANPQQVRERAQAAADLNIRIYTVSFGTSADQDLMRDVAQIGRADHYHASTAAELRDVFRQIGLTIPLTFTD